MSEAPPPASPAASSWSTLPTEARHPASAQLDTLPTDAVVALLVEEDRRGLERTLERTAEIALAADWLAETLAGGGSALLAGAGTSGRLADLEAAECPPTFGTDPERDARGDGGRGRSGLRGRAKVRRIAGTKRVERRPRSSRPVISRSSSPRAR
jgi:hypothetical protein